MIGILVLMTLVGLTILVSWADRFSGGGAGWDPKWPGKPLWYATLAMFPYAYLSGNWWMPLSFFIWRTPAWRILGSVGGMTPTNLKDTLLLAIRHSLIFIALPLYFFSGHTISQTLLLLCLLSIWVGGSAFLAAIMGSDENPSSVNGLVELARGWILGFIFGIITYA